MRSLVAPNFMKGDGTGVEAMGDVAGMEVCG
jgi:hypothetical protein